MTRRPRGVYPLVGRQYKPVFHVFTGGDLTASFFMPYTNWNASQAGNVHTPVFENLAIGHKVRVHQNDTSRFYGVRGSVASIGVRLVAGANVNAINATLGTLTKSQGGDSIGPSAHEIRTIKVWWGHEAQWWTNSRVGGTFNDILIPGPLLFNDALIGVDRDARTNTVGGEVKTTKSVPGSYSKPTHGAFTVTESASLQNFNLAPGKRNAYWWRRGYLAIRRRASTRAR